MIYFDYAATSIKRKDIMKYIYENSEKFDANPDSIHAMGRDAKKILEDCREIVAKSINANPKEIIFTSGASESNNTVLNAFKGKKILTSKIEHDSILNTIDKDNTILLNVDKSGQISLNELKENLSKDIKLVSIMYVNNEMGSILPIKEIGEILKDYDIWFHVDAVQAYGHIDIDVKDINCDSLSLSGHKIGGLNGFGILFNKNKLPSFIKGGEQEKNRRAGTSFVQGAYSMAHSYDKMLDERDHIRDLKKYFIEKLKTSNVDYEINGNIETSSDHILNLYFPNYKSDFLLTYLDMNGICISAGSACRAGTTLPSHVISNMYDDKRAMHSVRFSFGYRNTKDEIDEVIKVLERLKYNG